MKFQKKSGGWFLSLSLVGMLALAQVAMAQPQDQEGQEGQGRGRRGPPPEAIEACQGYAETEACAFEAPHGTVEGTCRTLRNNEVACVPEGHHRMRQQQQDGQFPPEA